MYVYIHVLKISFAISHSTIMAYFVACLYVQTCIIHAYIYYKYNFPQYAHQNADNLSSYITLVAVERALAPKEIHMHLLEYTYMYIFPGNDRRKLSGEDFFTFFFKLKETMNNLIVGLICESFKLVSFCESLKLTRFV